MRLSGAASAAFAVSLLAAPCSYAQDSAPAQQVAQNSPSSQPSYGQGDSAGSVQSSIPGFTWGASLRLAETYTTNSIGTSGARRDDYLTQLGLNTDLHEHSRRVSLDADYSGSAYFYAKDTAPTQFSNNLQAVANVIAIEDYLDFRGRAFAQPVMISNIGPITSNGLAPNEFRNSYGYSVGPNITFRLGDFASSDTMANYSAAYFTTPEGAAAFPLIPGVSGPEDTTVRTFGETLSSGPDFSRLNWTATAMLSEISRQQSLLSQKTAVANLRYAITREISLIGTGGYDALSNSSPLNKGISGPVLLGGFALNTEDLSLQIEVGEKYHSASYIGSLRYNISPTAVITGSATDDVSTPEGQLLGSLSNLTATSGGVLTSSGSIFANGTSSSLTSFSAQPPGSLSFNQNIARYQRVSLSFAEDFERNHAMVTLFGEKLTQLAGPVVGPPRTNSWGVQTQLARDISPLLRGSIGGDYTVYQELGGDARNFTVRGNLNYSLSPKTSLNFSADYLTRDSSTVLQALSPFTGSTDDLRLTLMLTHTL